MLLMGGSFVWYISGGMVQQQSFMPVARPDAMEMGDATPSEGNMGKDMDDSEMSPASDSVMVSARKQQMIGVKTTKAQVLRLTRNMRTVGQVEVDERLLEHVHIKLEGWVEKLYVRFTGEEVKKDQMLFEIYSPDLVATQDEYLLALKSVRELGDSEFSEVAEGARSLLEVTKRRFALWDITPDHIEDLERTGKVLRTLPLHAPISGYVLHMNLREGMYVRPDIELYTLADLSKIWVLADFYEYEIPEVKVGQQASITLAYFPGKKFQGKVTYIYPVLDPKTRTVKVRFEFPNPEWKLKPGMFANVELTIPLGRRLVVPNSAVLDSGTEQRIFVTKGEGMFEPRKVRVGIRTQKWYEILEGVKEGETVVSTANFLLDSESNLKAASGMMMPGMDMGSKNQSDDQPAMSGMKKSQ
ncbi:MAG: efflux RND transporter periplasmic adaptor subunit [Nitrospirota bacterium]|nr:MAG: efflux RND transporter periplasmic adaptor subunit [Nitrospirota bacterium]